MLEINAGDEISKTGASFLDAKALYKSIIGDKQNETLQFIRPCTSKKHAHLRKIDMVQQKRSGDEKQKNKNQYYRAAATYV